MPVDPSEIIEMLKDGNRRFLNGETIQSNESSLKKLREFAKNGQAPNAIVLCCSDSRAPVEMIFDQGIGDLFVIRVAGNIVAPSLIGSVEFAAGAFGTRLVLVMGHTGCGAITATLDNIEYSRPIISENLHDIVSRIKPHIYAIAQLKDVSHDDKLKMAVRANVMASVAQLTCSSRLIENLVREENLQITGAVLNLETGSVDFLEI